MRVSFPVLATHTTSVEPTTLSMNNSISFFSTRLLLLSGYESKLAISSLEVRPPRRALGFFPSFPESIVIRIDFIYKLAMFYKGAIIGKSAPRNIELT